MAKHGRTQPKQDAKKASITIAVGSVIGLTVCFVAAVFQKAEVPVFLYAIFGGGILGTDNILRLLKSVFRIDDK